MKPLTIGLLVGSFAGVAVVGLLAAGLIVNKSHDAKVGWRLVPTVVASQDVPEGTTLTFDMISQRSVPEQFVTDSTVLVDDASAVVGKKVTAPLQAGDPLEWQSFAELGGHEAIAGCVDAIVPLIHAAAERARARAVDAFVQRAGSVPDPAPHGLLAPAADADGNVSIVVLGADVKEGTVLTPDLVTTAAWPARLVTASKIPAEELSAAVGRRLVAPMQRGDPVLWQFLDDPSAPRSSLGCVAEAEGALRAAVLDTAAREANAYFAREVKR